MADPRSNRMAHSMTHPTTTRNLSAAYCEASEWVEAGLANPLALVVYVAACAALTATLSANSVTVILSHFANIMLILIAAAQYRKGKIMAREVDAVAEALPAVDHEAIRAEA